MDKPHVLIVEDNKINALVLRKALEKEYECRHVINDTQAFQAVQEAPYRVILMDINLGGNSLDGVAIMQRIRQNPAFSHVKIFAVTSYANQGDREKFLRAGFDAYYPKPINKNDIREGIRKALARPSA
ncbi:MAG: response regulator [Bacteroidetes bacterium]|nr:MAG: response regulator [Bacteroidota bacterium]